MTSSCRIVPRGGGRPSEWTGALLALLMAGVGCTGKPAQEAAPAGEAARASHEAAHPETFEAAKALATQRGVPLLVDFYSPT